MSKTKILFIEPFIPYPLTHGGAQAIFNGIQAVKDSYEVYVIALWEATIEQIKGFQAKVGEDVHVLPQKHIKKRAVHLPVLNRLILSLYYRSHSNRFVDKKIDSFELMTQESLPEETFLEYVNSVIEKENIGIVEVEMPMMMSMVLSLPSSIKKIYVHHELRFVRNQLEMKVDGENLYRKSAIEVNKILEINLLNKYDAIITLSPVDADKLKQAGVIVPIYSSFATVSTKSKISHYKAVQKKLSFVGPEFHVPNQEGMKWFLDKCWPLLLHKDPEYTLQIIGNWKEETRCKVSEKYRNVSFTGYVDNLHNAMFGSIMIVPITIGSGIRMKILEAAANGIPFVSTSVGVEGLLFHTGTDCFIADDPNSFTSSILKLQNISLANNFIDNALKTILTHYSIDALKRNRSLILSKIL